MFFSLLYVAFGGSMGAIGRFSLSKLFRKHVIATWIVNVVGSCQLAIVFRLYLAGFVSETTWLLLGVGFCGAFTTFSTFGHEMIQYIIHGKFIAAYIYAITSFFISIIIVFIILYI